MAMHPPRRSCANMKMSEMSKVVAEMTAAIQRDPKCATAYGTRGLAYLEQQD